MNPRIPRRIIQTGRGPDLSVRSRAAVANVRLMNPDFEYLFFDDKKVEEFINHEFSLFLNVLFSMPESPAQME